MNEMDLERQKKRELLENRAELNLIKNIIIIIVWFGYIWILISLIITIVKVW